MGRNAYIQHFLRSALLLVFIACSAYPLRAQEKVPFIFRKQKAKVTRRIHAYLRYDTLVKTSKAQIHINYSNDRTKPYLLLLHGMGVDGKTNWYRQIPYLSKYFNLLIPDLVFFGASTSLEKNYSVEFQAEQIHEVIQQLALPGKISLMGFSYGGLTAAVYNELYPAEINKLIIVDGPVKFFSAGTADSLALLAGVPSMTNIIIPQSLADYKAMEKAVLSRTYPVTRRLKLKLIEHYFTPGLKTRQAQLDYLISHERNYQSYNYNIEKTPTLLVWGAKDGVVPLSVGEKLHKQFPNSTQLIVLKRARHDGHFRYPKKLNRSVLKFLMN